MSPAGRSRRTWVVLAVFAVAVVATVLVSGPSPGNRRGPQGTLALRRYLSAMGMSVSDAASPPDGAGAVFLLTTDLRGSDAADDLLSWVRNGGTLVVTDPNSATLDAAGIDPDGNVGHYSFGPVRLAPGCVVPEAVGVASLQVDPADAALTSNDPGGTGCFPTSGAGTTDQLSFEVVRPMGQGRVVGLGGTSPLTNALLNKGDNPVFALGLLGNPAGKVVFGPAVAPGEGPPAGVWRSLPLVAKVALIEAGLALLAFAAVRARRLGKPMPEQVPSPVPASELVDAVGRLYRSARASAFAGGTLRRAGLRRAAARLGVAPGDMDGLALAIAARTGRDPRSVRALLAGAPPGDDAALIALGTELEELRRQVERSWV